MCEPSLRDSIDLRDKLLLRALNLLSVADDSHLAKTTEWQVEVDQLRADVLQEMKRNV